MRKVSGKFDFVLNSKCPYCNTVVKYNLNDFDNSSKEDNDTTPIENFFRGVIRVYFYGEDDVAETTVKCKKCSKMYIINKLERI